MPRKEINPKEFAEPGDDFDIEGTSAQVIDLDDPQSHLAEVEVVDDEEEKDPDERPEDGDEDDSGEETDEETEDDSDVEVVDDTPEADRDREASTPPEDLTDEELEGYSKKVQARMKKFARGYHDERRAKEDAERKLNELLVYTRRLQDEHKRVSEQSTKTSETVLAQAKRIAENELEAAKQAFKAAHDAGDDADALIAAQEKLTKAQIRLERLNSIKAPPLQKDKDGVQDDSQARVTEQPRPAPDPRAVEWASKNTWFGKDTLMTTYAYGVHGKLTREEGISPKTNPDQYYRRVDEEMRAKFPEKFPKQTQERKDPEPKPKQKGVVAPVSRGKAPKKLTLTKTQMRLAKELGVPPEEYAKQVKQLERK